MAIDTTLIEILVCPICQATIQIVDNGAGLKCTECLRVYPVHDDIPVMLVSEASIGTAGSAVNC
jgi:uncharacterized protein YbaR (Trm112 family)